MRLILAAPILAVVIVVGAGSLVVGIGLIATVLWLMLQVLIAVF